MTDKGYPGLCNEFILSEHWWFSGRILPRGSPGFVSRPVQFLTSHFDRFFISCSLRGPKSADKLQGETTDFCFDVNSENFQYLRN